ncbi:MAG TPA: helix-turn-helix domain-containing protein [Candidatus Alistipes avicola]|uniref:Helix-turn-helix domain-containing protein n=1 Tax=Candidatus Alistipes avicola TaxID=2838432 RepID=A0A9D2L4R0_9BACT|nr:helix-turn-helix domain-containing protein [uncultured Alistipes sp.]HJA99249.1 helix-turn-helix domain-containing protein [Candidatus Alistipes avicola]
MATDEITLQRISIPRIKEQMKDIHYLSDDLVISSLDLEYNIPREHPTMIDGFAAIIIISGTAVMTIDTVEYEVCPNTIVLLGTDRVVRTISCSKDLSAFLVVCSKSFLNDIQVDLSTSLSIYMRLEKQPCLQVTPQDTQEIRLIFQLIKTILASDKKHYRQEIIRSLFTAVYYLITELNLREHKNEMRQGRAEVIFDEFMKLLREYNRQERNVGFYAHKLNITPKYLSTVAKSVSGKTAAKWIDESVILEAKSLLRYSGLSIQEIAYRLNFSTQSFFGKYFKQHTGYSPSRFKRGGK